MVVFLSMVWFLYLFAYIFNLLFLYYMLENIADESAPAMQDFLSAQIKG